MRAAFLLLLLVGCAENGLKKQGEACATSSECAAGLLCDLTAKQCSGSENTMNVDSGLDGFVHPPVDGTPPPIDAAIDAPIDAPPDTM
jgi:hypothetical protein